MKLKDFKHELNSFLFKLEASAHLLADPENLSDKEITTISDIIFQNTKKIKLFFECFTLLEKIKEREHKTDRQSSERLLKEILSSIDRNFNTVIEGKETIFHGNFKPKDKIDRFFLECLRQLFKKIKITENEIRVPW